MNSLSTKILVGILVVFIILQFFGIDKSVPETDPSKDFITMHEPPAAVENLVRSACYDCHSYETEYPWYSNIVPVSWWMQDHINEARDEMNFSLWADYSTSDASDLLDDIVDEVESEAMPLPSYTYIHSDARLTDEQRQQLNEWVSSLRSHIQQNADSAATTEVEG